MHTPRLERPRMATTPSTTYTLRQFLPSRHKRSLRQCNYVWGYFICSLIVFVFFVLGFGEGISPATYLTLAQARVPDDENMRIAPCGYFAVPARAPEQSEDQPSLHGAREFPRKEEIKAEEIRRVVGAAKRCPPSLRLPLAVAWFLNVFRQRRQPSSVSLCRNDSLAPLMPCAGCRGRGLKLLFRRMS